MHDLDATGNPADFGVSALSFTPSATGAVDTSFTLDIVDGSFDVILPLRLQMSLDDQATPGTTVSIATSYSIADDATIQANTPGVSMDLTIDARDASATIGGPVSEVLDRFSSTVSQTFDVPTYPLRGVPLSVAFPSGVNTTGPAQCAASCARVSDCYRAVVADGYVPTDTCDSGGHLDDACWTDIFVTHGSIDALPSCADNQDQRQTCEIEVLSCLSDTLPELYRHQNIFAAAVPEAAGQTAYTNSKMLVTEAADAGVLAQTLDLNQFLADAGVPTFGLWWGQFELPLGGGTTGQFRYDLWSARWSYDLRIYAQYLVEVRDVTAQLQLEDGSTTSWSMSAGTRTLDLPQGADTNDDGVVDVQATFTVDATATQIWLWGSQIEWASTLLGMNYELYQSQPAGPDLLTIEGTLGPVRASNSVIGLPDLHVETWPVQGLVGTSSFAIQVTQP